MSEDQQSYNLNFSNGGDNIDINSISESNKNISIQTSDGVVIKNNDLSQKSSFSVKTNSKDGQRSIINKSNSAIEVTNSKNTNTEEKVIIQAKHSANFIKNNDEENIQILTQEEIIDTPATTTGSTIKPNKDKPKITPEPEEHVITSANIKTIQQILNKSFLTSEYNDLVVNYIVGKNNEYAVSIMNINRRLDRLAPLANIPLQYTDSLIGLKEYAKDIIR